MTNQEQINLLKQHIGVNKAFIKERRADIKQFGQGHKEIPYLKFLIKWNLREISEAKNKIKNMEENNMIYKIFNRDSFHDRTALNQITSSVKYI